LIIPDVNLLIYAYNRDARHHEGARSWWEGLLNTDERVGLPWAVGLGFVRLMTHPAVLVAPLEPRAAIRHVRHWLERPQVVVLEPGPRHLDTLESLLGRVGVGGNLTADAHLASLAIEHQAELHSNDTDFARFSGLRWRNPLA
jgi:toxin-antitoxin system PIN domain toxin